MHASLVDVMRRFLFVRETQGPNRGAWVQFIQRFCNGSPGDSWCAQILSMALDIAWYGKVPLIRSGRCQTILVDARCKGLVVPQPLAGDIFFVLDSLGHAHHVGVVTFIHPVTGLVYGVAGNTSPDGTSNNGTGVFEHTIPTTHNVYVRPA